MNPNNHLSAWRKHLYVKEYAVVFAMTGLGGGALGWFFRMKMPRAAILTSAGLVNWLALLASKAVRPPRIHECPVSLECHLVEIRDCGEFAFIVGKVILAWIVEDRRVCGECTAQAQLDRFPLLTYIYPDNYSVIDHAERFPSGRV